VRVDIIKKNNKMKFYFFIIGMFLLPELIAQNNIPLIGFVSLDDSVLTIDQSDIIVVDSTTIELTNSQKINKLVNFDLKEVFYYSESTTNTKIELFDVLSSQYPTNPFFILTRNNQLYFTHKKYINCSTNLIEQINKAINENNMQRK